MRKAETTNPEINDEEKVYEQSLRPLKLNDFVGQSKITDKCFHFCRY